MNNKQKWVKISFLATIFLLGPCGCENTAEIPATPQSPHSSVDHSHSQDEPVPPTSEPQPTPVVTYQDEGECPIPEARIDKNNPRFHHNHEYLFNTRPIFMGDTYVAYPEGNCTKYIHYSDGSQEVREKGYDYLVVMPRVDLHEAKMNGDTLEVKFWGFTAENIVVDNQELENAFGTSVYALVTQQSVGQKTGDTIVREGYSLYFFRGGATWEELQLFHSFPQTIDSTSHALFVDVSKDRAFFDKCLQEGSLTVKVSTLLDVSSTWPKSFMYRHPLVLKDK